MLLSLKSLVQVDLTGNYFWLADQTGEYELTVNPTGWGGQNPALNKSAVLVVGKRLNSFLAFVTPQLLYSVSYSNDHQLSWQMNYARDGWHRFWEIRLWVSNNGIVDIVGSQVLGPGDLFYIPAQAGKVWMKTGSGASAFIQITNFDDLLDSHDLANAQVFSEGLFVQNIERKKTDIFKKIIAAKLAQDTDTASRLMEDINDIRNRVRAAEWAFEAGLKTQANDIIESILDDYKIDYPAPLSVVPVTPFAPYSPFLFGSQRTAIENILLQLVPSGGAAGQVLAKLTDADFSFVWHTLVGIVPSGGTTGQFLKKNSNTNYDYSWVSGSLVWAALSDVTATLAEINKILASDSTTTKRKYKELLIGDWDMTTATGSATKLVNHGITNWQSIRILSIRIQTDAPVNNVYDLGIPVPATPIAGVFETTLTQIKLNSPNGGFFDQAFFNATPYNRGWITITYEE